MVANPHRVWLCATTPSSSSLGGQHYPFDSTDCFLLLLNGSSPLPSSTWPFRSIGRLLSPFCEAAATTSVSQQKKSIAATPIVSAILIQGSEDSGPALHQSPHRWSVSPLAQPRRHLPLPSPALATLSTSALPAIGSPFVRW
ncbi:hypothetical protein B296_00025944 [Ensete ventricosum]|uniref:Uncharacterized protein n=1 Tax=Ensete ventricosum TaxID=4639 RepID=A0A426YXJ8_ENSVE|nr:hypothetical protein B296_00025944 [Ensete ventricosum]